MQSRFEFVLMFSTGKIWSLAQNLKTTRNPMSSLDVKQRFEAMNIPGCFEVTAKHNDFKFSVNDDDTSQYRQLRLHKIRNKI